MARLVRPNNPNGPAPRCEHLATIKPVSPRSQTCTQCTAAGLTPSALWICLVCGWVACSDDSPGHHAKGHYEKTDHAIAGATTPGSTLRWCYAHNRAV